MDIDPALRVGQAIDTAPRGGVLPYREGRKGITAVSRKRHFSPSDSEVAPGRLLLRFRQHCGPAARRLVGIALGVRERLGLGVGAYIGGGQFVLALPASFQVSGQFVSAKLRTLLNADAMIAEDCEVRGDGNLL